jgi:plasminogen activator inhibitor 1 RNA-binding protein
MLLPLFFIPHSDTEKATNQGWGADTGAAELGAELQGAADARAEEVIGNGVVADTTGWAAPVADASGWDAPAAAAADTSGWDAPAADAPAADASGWDAPAADTSGWGAPAPVEAANGEANKDGKEGEERRRRRDDEDEDNTLTLDEYLAKKRADEQAALPKLDGQRVIKDNNEWKGAVQLHKEDNEYFVGKVKPTHQTSSKI